MGDPEVRYSFGFSVLIICIFAVFDVPYFVAIALYNPQFTSNYTVSVFALLFLALSMSTYSVYKSINKL